MTPWSDISKAMRSFSWLLAPEERSTRTFAHQRVKALARLAGIEGKLGKVMGKVRRA